MSRTVPETSVATDAGPLDTDQDQSPTGGGGDHESGDDLLLSHVVAPSHILADGRFVRLPPPSASERSAFFERAVVTHRVISVDGEEGRGGRISQKQRRDETTAGSKKRRKTDAPFVHPLAVASARLRAKGVNELSKAINLGGLVMGGKYFGLTNIIDQRSTTKKKDAPDVAAAGGNGEKNGNGANPPSASGVATSSADGLAAADESILLDQRLRSKYVLQRRRSQYGGASTALSRHSRRLSSSVSATRVIDARQRLLRGWWRLVAPEHGTRTAGPVRPREVVAVDVEVYDRDRMGGGSRAAASGGDGVRSSLGRIARRVPRFATMELDDQYDVSMDILSLRSQIKRVLNDMMKVKDTDENITTISAHSMKAYGVDAFKQKLKGQSSPTAAVSSTCKTKAEPYAVADPTLGKIDPDFDPDKVPLLTLLFEIEKPSTGFIEHATLSSSLLSFAANGGSPCSDGKQHLHPDERAIEALQHSLFCASLFESMRGEILPTSTQSGVIGASSQQQRQKTVAWLPSEMEESFLPPPSVMVGGDMGRVRDARLLSVTHCHEGEVKVQLDEEYSLTVKLIEAGTAAAAATAAISSNAGDSVTPQQQQQVGDYVNGVGASGSQSPAQLQTLCRVLLLHSQSLYHEHKTKLGSMSASDTGKDSKPVSGFVRKKKEVKTQSPHILQNCVGLGCKFIFEKKVRLVLKKLSQWLDKDMDCSNKIAVEWLPLTLFDIHSRFVLLFLELCLDIGISGDTLHVTSMSSLGDFRAAEFGSVKELECFLKQELRGALVTNFME